MENSAKQALIAWGVDWKDAMGRFLDDEDMYQEFIGQFVTDENFAKMKESIEAGDVVAAFEAGHTLKGVAGQLSLGPLLEPLVPLVEILRSKSLDGAKEACDKVFAVNDTLAVLLKENGII